MLLYFAVTRRRYSALTEEAKLVTGRIIQLEYAVCCGIARTSRTLRYVCWAKTLTSMMPRSARAHVRLNHNRPSQAVGP
jgi:hypothetical protein